MKKFLMALGCLMTSIYVLGMSSCNVDDLRNKDTMWTMETAYAQAQELGYTGSLESFLESIRGKDGVDGINGKDGIGIEEIYINEQGHLFVKMTGEDNARDLGKVTGQSNQTSNIENLEEFDFYLLDNDTYGIRAGNAVYLSEITIPSTYKGKKVSRVLSNFFGDNQTEVKKLVIPDSIEIIDDRAFEGCYSLREVSIGNCVEKIESSTFLDCLFLDTVHIGANVKEIEIVSFGHCMSLRVIDVSIENTMYKSIDGNLYSKDGSILYAYAQGQPREDFKMPNMVTKIYDYAFLKSKKLKSVTLSNSLIEIGSCAFSNCTSLSSIKIPATVNKLNFAAFYNCTSLTAIEFENVYGWSVRYDESSTPIQLDSSVLQKNGNACLYLTNTYKDYIWLRTEN